MRFAQAREPSVSLMQVAVAQERREPRSEQTLLLTKAWFSSTQGHSMDLKSNANVASNTRLDVTAQTPPIPSNFLPVLRVDSSDRGQRIIPTVQGLKSAPTERLPTVRLPPLFVNDPAQPSIGFGAEARPSSTVVPTAAPSVPGPPRPASAKLKVHVPAQTHRRLQTPAARTRRRQAVPETSGELCLGGVFWSVTRRFVRNACSSLGTFARPYCQSQAEKLKIDVPVLAARRRWSSGGIGGKCGGLRCGGGDGSGAAWSYSWYTLSGLGREFFIRATSFFGAR